VALSGDGATALVGAPGVSGDEGEAYLFRRDVASWATSGTPSATLSDGAGTSNDQAGASVALSGDGVTALVGASGVSSGRGAAYVFASPAPTVSSVSPPSGPAGGGTSVTVTGTGFTGATGVTFGATPGTGLVVNGPTSITVVSPAGSGTVDVRVTTATGTSPAAPGGRFTYEPVSSVTTPPTGSGAPASSRETVPAGGWASSAPPGAAPSPEVPLIASVMSPVGGNVTFTRTTGGPPVDGYSMLDYGMVITSPPGTVAEPLVVVFEVAAATMPAGATVSSLTVFRNGVPIGPCSTSVDPCVASRTLTDGVIRTMVHTSHASTWTFASAEVSRVAGADRVGTAVAASRSVFEDGSANAVVLARSDDFADALAGGPLASANQGPLLLTASADLDTAVLDEVRRVLSDAGTAFVLGGPAAISDTVVESLQLAGIEVVRLAGADRYATAVAVAERGLGNPETVIEVSGHDFADALSAGAAAAEIGAAILLTDGARQAPVTAAYLAARSPIRFAIGAAAADPVAESIARSDRYATAVAVMHRFFPGASTAVVASGETYADGLIASTTAAKLRVPLLLVPGTSQLPPSVFAAISGLGRVALVGGTTAIGDDIADAIAAP
jgi:putative cell wall-binding protein